MTVAAVRAAKVENGITRGETAVRRILSEWKTNFPSEATTAAYNIGLIHSICGISDERARVLIKFHFDAHKMDDVHWSSVHEAFLNGRNTVSTPTEVLNYFLPEPANDNDLPDLAPTSKDQLSELTDPGGFVSEIIDWVVSSSDRPSRELALSAVIPFVGALLGRRYASPTDLRTNFYTVALADSGYGKDHARTQLKRLITSAGLDMISGPNRFMSATALRGTVSTKPSCLCMVDEFGGMMRQINDPRAGIHSLLIRSDLLEMFTSASTYFEGAAYAKEAPQKIYNPNLCIYGTSTPDDFWASVSSLNTTDGLLPRFLLFNVAGPKPSQVTPSRTVDDVPKSLIDAVQALALSGRGAGNLSHNEHGSIASKPTKLPYSAEAEAELKLFKDVVEQTATTPGSSPILNRAVEHAIKLALIVSVGDGQNEISGQAMKWAVQLAWLSTCIMVEETADRISDNQREADRNRIFGHIKRAGTVGITEGKIADRCASIDRKRRDELLSDLTLSGRIVIKSQDTKGRPQKRYYPA